MVFFIFIEPFAYLELNRYQKGKGNYMLTIRKMEPSEAKDVKKIAMRAFSFIEALFISKPKEAMIAVMDDQIVGGIIIKYLKTNNQLIGYYDGAFIHPNFQGQGIGQALYEQTTKYLWEQGCTAQTALVKDDNVSSWKLFLNNGFNMTTLRTGVRQLGVLTMLKHYFMTPLFISNGMEFYLLKKDQTVPAKKVKSLPQIIAFLFINLILICVAYRGGVINFFTCLCAYALLLVGGVLFEYIGTLCSKRKWEFRLNSGGAVIVTLINFIGGVFPMIGRWYPKNYEKTTTFKKDLGISAVVKWSFILILTLIASYFAQQFFFFKQLLNLGRIFLLFHMLCIYPFESYGGRRVFEMSKSLYLFMSLLSVLVIIFC